MLRLARYPLFLGVALVAACTDSLGPSASTEATSASAAVSERITVMTRNMYIGNDVDVVIAELGAALAAHRLDLALAAIERGAAVIRETDFPARVNALAGEIARYRPHVIGLQEVEELKIDLRDFGSSTNIDQDFVASLQSALMARGLNTYQVAAEVTNIHTEPVPGVSLTDHDVLLVDTRRVSWNTTTVVESHYDNNAGAVIPGVLSLIRGFVMIDATIGGQQIRIANTHLESGRGDDLSLLRAAQAGELLTAVGTASPAILLGDFNDPEGTDMYSLVRGAGFADLWRAMRPGARGFTCCHVADLSNKVSVLSQRIDFIFARGLGGTHGKLQGQVTIIGDQPGDRLPGPLHPIWPSDHAGLVAQFLQPPATGLALAR